MTKYKKYRLKLRQRVSELVGFFCVFCRDYPVEMANVKDTKLKGVSRGLVQRYLDVIKHPDSYRPMCKKCHRTFDKLIALNKTTEQEIPF